MLNRIVSFSDIAHDQQGLISRELISIAFTFRPEPTDEGDDLGSLHRYFFPA
jgi:hypothetical protein